MSKNKFEHDYGHMDNRYMGNEDYADELDRMRAGRRGQHSSGSKHAQISERQISGRRISNQRDNRQDNWQDNRQERRPASRQISYTLSENNGYTLSEDNGYTLSKDELRHPPGRAVRKSHRRKKKKHKLKFFIFAILLISAFFFVKRWMKVRDGYWNIAVFGVDSRDNNLEKGALADVQMIASINKKTGEIRLVSVFRDTYVQINDDGDFHKINEAYFKGGHKQAIETLKRNLDIQVDDYATFNWKAVADAINILGGIDLEITDSEFRYINSFITETVESTGVYSTHLASAGWNHLDGVQAVAYSRLRLMDTDFNRTERQRKVVSLALDKAKQSDLTTLKTVIGTVIPEISTSIGIEDVIPMAKDVKHYHLGQSAGFPFAKTTADVGKLDCVIPMTLESNVILLHQFLFDQEFYQPSLSVKTISKKISERTGIYEEGKAAGADKNLSGSPQNSSENGNSQSGGEQNANLSGENSGEVSDGNGQLISESAAESVEYSNENLTEDLSKENLSKEDSGYSESSAKEGNSKGSTRAEEETTIQAPPAMPEESSLSDQQIHEGPGSANPTSAADYTKPAEAATEEAYGPGFEN